MKRNLQSLILTAIFVIGFAVTTQAEINWSGDVIPTDPSTWTSATNARIGDTSLGSLTITDGSYVESRDADLGSGDLHSRGLVRIDGFASAWNVYGYLNIGRDYHSGGSGFLSIANSGTVASNDGSIGYSSSVVVDGTGSLWNNGGNLDIYGRLDIANGASVVSNSGGNVSGVVTVDGVGSHWSGGFIENGGQASITNGGNGGSIELNGGSVTVSGEGSALRCGWQNWNNSTSHLSITNGASVVSNYGGVNISGVATVDGVGSAWSWEDYSSDNSIIGQLSITNGAAVGSLGNNYSSGQTYIGNGQSAGSAIVDGIGSMWSIEELIIGYYGGSGQLIISNGGTVANDGGQILQSGSVTVDGAGSFWNCSSSLGVGGHLNITGGASVVSNSGGNVSGVVTVDGVGSAWDWEDNYNNEITGQLNITNGAAVGNLGNNYSSGQTYIGNYESAGSVTVDGAGSMWNVGELRVGEVVGNGGTGQLTIRRGAMVVNSNNGYIGDYGSVTVDGQGSVWNNSQSLDVHGQLNITNGGRVTSLGGSVDGGVFKSMVIIDGIGSAWESGNDFHISGDGRLNIINGGFVNNQNGRLDGAGMAIVDGIGSIWENSLSLFIGGGEAGFGQLSITNGGMVIVDGTLDIDTTLDYESFVNISEGGQLILSGNAADSIVSFLDLVEGSDDIRFWDAGLGSWDTVANAVMGVDYTLDYVNEYTVLTVNAIPEPMTVALLGLGGLMLRRRKKA